MTKVKEGSELKPADPIRGMAKSGRFWKSPKERSSTNIKSKKKQGLARLNQIREERSRVKELSSSIIEARKTEISEKRRREFENKQRKEENARKSEVVQVIKNSAKLKRMKKKQLKKVEKRDTTVIQKDPSAVKFTKKPEVMETS